MAKTFYERLKEEESTKEIKKIRRVYRIHIQDKNKTDAVFCYDGHVYLYHRDVWYRELYKINGDLPVDKAIEKLMNVIMKARKDLCATLFAVDFDSEYMKCRRVAEMDKSGWKPSLDEEEPCTGPLKMLW